MLEKECSNEMHEVLELVLFVVESDDVFEIEEFLILLVFFEGELVILGLFSVEFIFVLFS
jgi:hypothetical protein